MDEVKIPNLLFKYKTLNDKTELERVLMLLSENKMYLPDYTQLNDPLEGASVAFNLGICGQFLTGSADEEIYFVKEAKTRFKIISFSSTCNSPQLWAHYGGNYSGLCIGFSTDRTFKNVRKVIYTEYKPSAVTLANGEGIDDIILDNFLHKEKNWAYEQEWRYIDKTDNRFLKFQNEDIKCVLLGHQINPDYKKTIMQALIDYHVPILRTHIGVLSYKIRFLPVDYVHIYDGSSPPFIDDIIEL